MSRGIGSGGKQHSHGLASIAWSAESPSPMIKSLRARATRILARVQTRGPRQRPHHEPGPPHSIVKLIEYFASLEPAPDVLYLGDSVVERVSRNDRDTRTLGDMVSLCLNGRLTVGSISRTGYHMGVFRGVVRALAAMPTWPKMVVFPVNMRTFSPQWDLRPMWQYDEEINSLENCAASLLESVEAIAERAEGDAELVHFDNVRVRYPMTTLSSIGEFRDVIARRHGSAEMKRFRLRQIFIFHYLHDLVPDHRRIVALRDLLSTVDAMGVRALAYISPVNFAAGIRRVGAEFEELFGANVARVCEVIMPFEESGRVRLQDWSVAFDSRSFFHEDEPTEHLNEVGRMNLAGKIAEEVLELSQVKAAGSMPASRGARSAAV